MINVDTVTKPLIHFNINEFTNILNLYTYIYADSFLIELILGISTDRTSLKKKKLILEKSELLNLVSHSPIINIQELIEHIAMLANKSKTRDISSSIYFRDIIEVLLASANELVTEADFKMYIDCCQTLTTLDDDKIIDISKVENDDNFFATLQNLLNYIRKIDDSLYTLDFITEQLKNSLCRKGKYYLLSDVSSALQTRKDIFHTMDPFLSKNELINQGVSTLNVFINLDNEEKLRSTFVEYELNNEDKIERNKILDSLAFFTSEQESILDKLNSFYSFSETHFSKLRNFAMNKGIHEDDILSLFVYFIPFSGVCLSNTGLFSTYLEESCTNEDSEESFMCIVRLALHIILKMNTLDSEVCDFFEDNRKLISAFAICSLFYSKNRISNASFLEYFDSIIEKIASGLKLNTSSIDEITASVGKLFYDMRPFSFKYVISKKVRNDIKHDYGLEIGDCHSDTDSFVSDISMDEIIHDEIRQYAYSEIDYNHLKNRIRELLDTKYDSVINATSVFFTLASMKLRNNSLILDTDTKDLINVFDNIINTSDNDYYNDESLMNEYIPTFVCSSLSLSLKTCNLILFGVENKKLSYKSISKIRRTLLDIQVLEAEIFCYTNYSPLDILVEKISGCKNEHERKIVPIFELTEELIDTPGDYINIDTFIEISNNISYYDSIKTDNIIPSNNTTSKNKTEYTSLISYINSINDMSDLCSIISNLYNFVETNKTRVDSSITRVDDTIEV